MRPVALAFALACTLAATSLLGAGCAGHAGGIHPDGVRPDQIGAVQEGEAAWYADRFHGRRTASGEPYDKRGFTAAHRTLRLGTRCRVTNQKNGRRVVVRINDRGPGSHKRIIDLSRAAAEALDFISAGHARVLVEVLR
ncbi:MAG TPA: septal ring lytic transglycosylase RlpA family protein [Polyangia bacterium]|jgi:rare lipoprotein A